MTAEPGAAKKGGDAARSWAWTPPSSRSRRRRRPCTSAWSLVLDPPEGTRSLFSPSTRYAQIRRVIEQRLHLIAPVAPAGRAGALRAAPPGLGRRPRLRARRPPEPGQPARRPAGRPSWTRSWPTVMSRQLDPDRPLWEMHVVEGLEGDRTALVAKVHHAILDGVSGASVLAAFLDLTPAIARRAAAAGVGPGAAAVQRADAAPRRLVAGAAAGCDAEHAAGRAWRRWRTSGCTTGSWPAGASSRRPASSPRRGRRSTARSPTASASPSLSVPLDDVKLVGRVFEATVNDVILAGVSGGLRRLLDAARGGDRTQPLVAMVPGLDAARGTGGGAREPGLGDAGLAGERRRRPGAPARRHLASRRGSPRSRRSCTGDASSATWPRSPCPALAARVARAVAGTRLFDKVRPPFNVTVSSVRGPDFSLFCAGSRVVDMYPVGPMAEGIGVNVTVFSYLDRVYFGLLACRRLLPELDEVAVAHRRRAGRAGGLRPRCPGGDGLSLRCGPG